MRCNLLLLVGGSRRMRMQPAHVQPRVTAAPTRPHLPLTPTRAHAPAPLDLLHPLVRQPLVLRLLGRQRRRLLLSLARRLLGLHLLPGGLLLSGRVAGWEVGRGGQGGEECLGVEALPEGPWGGLRRTLLVAQRRPAALAFMPQLRCASSPRLPPWPVLPLDRAAALDQRTTPQGPGCPTPPAPHRSLRRCVDPQVARPGPLPRLIVFLGPCGLGVWVGGVGWEQHG